MYISCDDMGTCEPFCSQYTEQMNFFNSEYSSCSVDGDCTTGFTCDTTSTGVCKVMTCTEDDGKLAAYSFSLSI